MQFTREKLIFFLRVITLCFIVVPEPFALADWVNVSGAAKSPNIAEIHIDENKIKLILEISPEDIQKFVENLQAERLNLPKFFNAGSQLQGSIQLLEKRQRITRKSSLPSFTGKEPSPEVYHLEVTYPYKQRPNQLEILAPTNEHGVMSTIIGFIVFHQDVPVIDFAYLPKKSILHLNWKDPWYSAFEHRNLTRHHKFPLMSFLYVEPFEVRHEFLVRLKDLQPWIKFEFSGKKTLNSQEQEQLKNVIGELALKHNPIRIAGRKIKPTLERIEFVKASREGIRIRKRAKSIAVNTATVGVILSYITSGMPNKVSLSWDMFSAQITRIPLRIQDPAGPSTREMTRSDNTVTWNNRLKNYTLPEFTPVKVHTRTTNIVYLILLSGCILIFLISLIRIRSAYIHSKPLAVNFAVMGLAAVLTTSLYTLSSMASSESLGKISMTPAQEKAIVAALLKNTYRALELKKDGDIYNRLQISVTGNFLEELYLQRKKFMKMQLEGDVNVKLKELTVTALELERKKSTSTSYVFKCKWKALGSLGHWGHMHNRRYVYEAMITMIPVNGAWKITDIKWIAAQKVASS